MSSDPNSVFIIKCECCGSKIHVDPKTRSLFYIERTDGKKRSFEEVVEDVTSVPQRAADKFAANLESEKGKEQRLEDAFEKAKKKAAKDPNKRPPSIFDYD
ncbi:MAG: hypothetical protein AAF581_02775 [Planctomycetota bacterium]